MAEAELERLPGAEFVLAGIADLEAGRASVNASAVQCAARRLLPPQRDPRPGRRLRAGAPGTRMYLTGGAREPRGLRLRPLLQALSKLERGFELELLGGIEDPLYRFPAVDPARPRAAVESLGGG